ncbi:MAG: DUF2130 domain-containing protein [Chitinophagia bacterium]|jgi:hypothetical protein|nr:DUF2130 domain-containing protein [Chitinophagia bacterium]NCA29886.1 DUF2130 domain-containing protein [Chitinophagia bacterium]
MSTYTVTCPKCQHNFEPTDAIREEVEKELRGKMTDWQKKKEEETNILLAEQKIAIENELAEKLKKDLGAQYDHKIKLMQQNESAMSKQVKDFQEKELEFLKQVQAIQAKEAELELELQRKLVKERETLKAQIQKEEIERGSLKDQEYQLKVKELEKQLEDQRKLAEEMKRKAEQGSMQMQGEVQELLLEELLKSSFPFDEIVEVGKGVRGADCIQIVRNNLGQEAGKIIYESKRTTAFAQEWIEKLKADMRSQGADIAIIVTQAFPKDMERFGEKEGVYICSYQEVKSVALLLRTALLKLFDAKKNQLNKGDKMSFLYDYLTSNEFNEQWKAIGEGFRQMRQSIQKERDAMEKLWKSREKQLEKVLLNAMHIKGSIEGIAGADSINMNLLEDDEPLSLED